MEKLSASQQQQITKMADDRLRAKLVVAGYEGELVWSWECDESWFLHSFCPALITCKCNALLVGLPCSTIQHLQRVENAAARFICDLRPRDHDHVTPALKHLHWLPIKSRIVYKLCLLMHDIHTGRAPQYLADCVSPIEMCGNGC